MLRTILVDDERPALNALAHLLKSYPDIEIAGSFTDPELALQFINRNTDIQLIFLDIDMPKLSGIATAKALFTDHPGMDIIFVTAYQNFAVDAFEVNAVDYILKPISPKRLKQAISKLARKRQAALNPATREEQAVFLNQLLSETETDLTSIRESAQSLGINFNQPFTFFFMLLPDYNAEMRLSDPKTPTAAIFNRLAEESGLLVWPAPDGLGMLDYNVGVNGQTAEIQRANQLKTFAESCSPGITVFLGIAGPSASFAARYRQCRNAAMIGRHFDPAAGVYHYSAFGLLASLDQYVNPDATADIIHNTIGKLLEYDEENHSELFHTMEQIFFRTNLHEVAQTLFIHYKTVAFRKQNIEKILGFSMTSFTGRTVLGMALTLYYLQKASVVK